MNELERFLAQDQSIRLLQSIESAVWSIAALVLVAVVLLLLIVLRTRPKRAEPNWHDVVEKAYDAGQYDSALQTLRTAELFHPRSALLNYWQAKCYFQQEAWEKAAEKFEACCRLEPPYRRSVRDYMAFIELNELVPGVTGYSNQGKEGADS